MQVEVKLGAVLARGQLPHDVAEIVEATVNVECFLEQRSVQLLVSLCLEVGSSEAYKH